MRRWTQPLRAGLKRGNSSRVWTTLTCYNPIYISIPTTHISICYNAHIMKKATEDTTNHIVKIPGVLGGKPVIKGTRIPVDLILERLTFDLDVKTLFEDYPELTEADIKACIAFAKELVDDEESLPTIESDNKQAHV